MTHPRKKLTAAEIGEGKRLYETTRVPITEIAARLGISYARLARLAKDKTWRPRRPARPPRRTKKSPAAASAGYVALPADQSERTALAGRLQNAVEREIAAVESLLATMMPPGAEPAAPDDTERAARTLASLARTLSELARLEFCEPAAAAPEGNDDVPRDLEELRRALARKLADFTAGADPGVSGDAAEG